MDHSTCEFTRWDYEEDRNKYFRYLQPSLVNELSLYQIDLKSYSDCVAFFDNEKMKPTLMCGSSNILGISFCEVRFK